MMKLIQQAAALAIFDGSSRITDKHFADALRKRTQCPDSENWFLLKPNEMKDLFGSVRPKGKAIEEKRREEEIQKHEKKTRRRVVDALAGRK